MPEARETTYFDTPERAERLQLVAHLVRNADVVPYVRGPAGAGKTRFAEQLLLELGKESIMATLFSARCSDVPAAICQSLGVALGDWPRVVLDDSAAGELVVLVDDADALNPQAQADLLALQLGGGRLVMFGRGDPAGFSEQWPIQLIDLPPLTETQARDFLAQMGHPDAALLSDAALHRLHQQAAGQPGALLAGPMSERSKVPAGMPAGSPWKWALGGVIGLLVVLVLWQQERINGLFAPPPVVEQMPAEVELPSPPEIEVPDNQIAIPPLPVEPIPTPEIAIEPSPAEPMDSESVMRDEGGEIAEPLVAETDSSRVAAPRMGEPPSTVIDIPEENGAPIAEPQAIIRPSVAPPALPQPAPPVPVTQPTAPPPVSEETQAIAPAPLPVPIPPAASPQPVVPPQPPSTAKRIEADDVAWLRSRPPRHYTLQLLGARDLAAIEKYLRANRLPGKYVIFTRDLAGKPWYSLVHGDYPNRDAALKGRDALPTGLRKADVWPRTFASVVAQLPAVDSAN